MTLLDEETPPADPLAGTMIGSCEVVGSLVPGKPSALLAFKLDLNGGTETVLLHKLSDGAQPPASAVADAEEATGISDSHLERVFGIESGELGSYWVTEYVPGATLEEIRNVGKQGGVPMSMGFGLAAVADAALGLQQLHARQNAKDPLRPRAHGLLRPQHIVVGFGGSAKLLNPRYLSLPRNSPVDAEWFAGNAGYLAPEAIRGETVDPRSDVFSLAVLVHELLTNKILFAGRNPRERADATMRGAQVPPSRLNLSLTPAVDDAVMRALSVEPSQRFANAGDFHRALKQAVGPYMWKESQRSEYMERLFGTRSRRTRELTTLMKVREAAAIERAAAAKRAEEQRLADEAAAKAAAEEAERVARAQAAEAARLAAQQAAEASRAAKPPPPKPAGKLPVPLLAAAGGAALLIVGVVGWLVFRSPPEEPVPVVTPPPVAPVAVQADAADAGSDAGTEEADAGAEAADGGATDAVPDAGQKKKKKKNEVPLPPWLRK